METLKVYISMQGDGLTFSMLPSTREKIKKLIPESKPVNRFFISFDTKEDFEFYIGKFDDQVLPILFGIKDNRILSGKLKEIIFLDSETDKEISKIRIN